MNQKFLKRKILLIFSAVFIFLLFYNSQTVRVNQQDEHYLQLFLNDWGIHETPEQVHKDFESEFSFISRIQDSVISQVKHKTISHQNFGDVAFYYSNKKGECFDRAVLLEKFFSYYHFPFRHIYVYFGRNGNQPKTFDFFKKPLSSHALTEVKTKKGWMTVGTNSNWLGIDSSGAVMNIADFRADFISNHLHLKKVASMGLPPFWSSYDDFRYVYGIYSRHGDFFNHENKNVSVASVAPTSFHLLPDYNLKMLLYNFRH